MSVILWKYQTRRRSYFLWEIAYFLIFFFGNVFLSVRKERAAATGLRSFRTSVDESSLLRRVEGSLGHRLQPERVLISQISSPGWRTNGIYSASGGGNGVYSPNLSGGHSVRGVVQHVALKIDISPSVEKTSLNDSSTSARHTTRRRNGFVPTPAGRNWVRPYSIVVDENQTVPIHLALNTSKQTEVFGPNFRNGNYSRDIVRDLEVFGIDLVVPWVNMSDPNWRAAKFGSERCEYGAIAKKGAKGSGRASTVTSHLGNNTLPNHCVRENGENPTTRYILEQYSTTSRNTTNSTATSSCIGGDTIG